MPQPGDININVWICKTLILKMNDIHPPVDETVKISLHRVNVKDVRLIITLDGKV